MAISIYSFDVHVIAELASGFILMVFIVLNLTVVVLRGAGPNTNGTCPTSLHCTRCPKFTAP